ncbi:MAG: hypothetical protein JZU70_07455 [Chlorobium sp.]|jgi:hypothetical protein|nr:hypothetical protein [Chlorobium sp.]
MNVAAEQYFGFIVSNPNGTHDIRVDQRSAERHVVAEFHRLVEVTKRLNPLAIVYAACEADFESLVQWPKDEEARLRAADGLNIPIAGGFIDLIHILEQHFYSAYCFSRC